jgi:hypothetical protein
VSNAATQILLKQARQAIDAVGDAFGLTVGERRLLLAARTGQGLIISGTSRTSFEAVSAPAEHALATTCPEFLASLDDFDGTLGEHLNRGSGCSRFGDLWVVSSYWSMPDRSVVAGFGGLRRRSNLSGCRANNAAANVKARRQSVPGTMNPLR